MPREQESPLHLPRMEGRVVAGEVPWAKAGEAEGRPNDWRGFVGQAVNTGTIKVIYRSPSEAKRTS